MPEVWADFARVFFTGLLASKELEAGIEARARVAIEQVYVMGHQMGGSQPYIPRGAFMEARRGIESIRREFRGNNYGELATRYDLSVSRVRSIVNPSRRPGVGANVINFPSTVNPKKDAS